MGELLHHARWETTSTTATHRCAGSSGVTSARLLTGSTRQIGKGGRIWQCSVEVVPLAVGDICPLLVGDGMAVRHDVGMPLVRMDRHLTEEE